MPRPPLPSRESSSFSGHPPAPNNRPELVPLLAEISIYVVPAKLDVGEVIEQIDALGGERSNRPEDARLVVTALRGRPRLARVLGDAVVSCSGPALLPEEWDGE